MRVWINMHHHEVACAADLCCCCYSWSSLFVQDFLGVGMAAVRQLILHTYYYYYYMPWVCWWSSSDSAILMCYNIIVSLRAAWPHTHLFVTATNCSGRSYLKAELHGIDAITRGFFVDFSLICLRKVHEKIYDLTTATASPGLIWIIWCSYT